jgi:hypothetical protein
VLLVGAPLVVDLGADYPASGGFEQVNQRPDPCVRFLTDLFTHVDYEDGITQR